MTVRRRIYLLVGFPFIVIAVTAALLSWSDYLSGRSSEALAVIDEGASTAASVGQSAVSLQVSASEFLRRSSPDGVSRTKALLAELRGHALTLASAPTPEQYAAKAVASSIDTITASLEALAAFDVRLGFSPDEGTQGSFRTAIRKLEEGLKEQAATRGDIEILNAQNLLLTVRRHEKDFLLRLDQRYVSDLVRAASDLTGVLKSTSFGGRSTAFVNLVGIYTAAFEEHVRILALRDLEADRFQLAVASISSQAGKLQDRLQKAFTDATAYESARRSVSNQLNKIALIISGVLTIVYAIIVAGGLSRRIKGISTTLDELASGNLQVKIDGTEQQDEIGQIARSAATFRDNLARVRELEAQERAATAVRIAQAENMVRVVDEVGAVVTAAAQGDFKARLKITSDDPHISQLVSGINAINTVVDQATSEFAESLGRVAQGDLTAPVYTDYQGRFADLKNAINHTISRLADMVATIQVTAREVAISAYEINAGADELSRRTENQAASLQETAATAEQLSTSVKTSVQASRQAVAIAEEATSVAETGGSIVHRAIGAMADIEVASRKISDINLVIDDIAFQTNLLALNAAVEAARAGDAGKGFAVVASEVRSLAHRSSEAAKQITTLIQTSTSQISDGVELVRSAGGALNQIVCSSKRTAATIAEFSTAASEQANGIQEISETVTLMDEITHQNAAFAEESSASADTLTQQIARLNQLVAAFKTVRNAQLVQAA
jgi:methyl-accepting chemotaxis protein